MQINGATTAPSGSVYCTAILCLANTCNKPRMIELIHLPEQTYHSFLLLVKNGVDDHMYKLVNVNVFHIRFSNRHPIIKRSFCTCILER